MSSNSEGNTVFKYRGIRMIKDIKLFEITGLQYFDVLNEDEPAGSGYYRRVFGDSYSIRFAVWTRPNKKQEFGFLIDIFEEKKEKEEERYPSFYYRDSPWKVSLRHCDIVFLRTSLKFNNNLVDKTSSHSNQSHHRLQLKEVHDGILQVCEGRESLEYGFVYPNEDTQSQDFHPNIITSMRLTNGSVVHQSELYKLNSVIYDYNLFQQAKESLKAGYYIYSNNPISVDPDSRKNAILEKDNISGIYRWSEIGGSQDENHPDETKIQTVADLICQQSRLPQNKID